MAPGHHFSLCDHPEHDGADPTRDTFVVLGVGHSARSNLQSGSTARLDQLLGGVVDQAVADEAPRVSRRLQHWRMEP